MTAAGLAEAADRMRRHGIPEPAISVFEHAYAALEAGATGTIPEASIEPLTGVPALADLSVSEPAQREALARTVVIKLNGGLGTSMGLSGAKTLLPVHDGLTFLDVLARQVLAIRDEYGVELPLILMNSFRTDTESLQALTPYADLPVAGLPLAFLQNAEPKVRAVDLTPVDWPQDPALEWCPPGHGDIYVALYTTGLLQTLRERGYRYAFLSNSDNLGATPDGRIPGWMAQEGLSFVAEICPRTANDRKGGHLARRVADGRIVLRDTAMVVPGEEHYFADETRHTTFHANNLWVDLDVLAGLLEDRGGVLGLPLIVNRKTVDPTRPDSTPVIQLESAMGAAIETFERSAALVVTRDRFRPVKTTNELVLIRSDRFEFDRAYRLVEVATGVEPRIDLDEHFRLIDDFDERFPHGVPGLRDCTGLTVRGDWVFGADVTCVGEVTLTSSGGRHTVSDGTTLGDS